MVNDFFAATDTAGYIGKALLGCQPQAAGYPKGVATTAPYAFTALTKLYDLICTGDGTTDVVSVHDASGYFRGEPLAGGGKAPGQFTFLMDAGGADNIYVNVATAVNDFGLTSASAPWLFGVRPGKTGTVIAGPSSTVGTAWGLTAAGDGTTGTVTVLRTTSADGPFIVEVV